MSLENPEAAVRASTPWVAGATEEWVWGVGWEGGEGWEGEGEEERGA